MAAVAAKMDLDQRVHGAQALATGTGDRGATPGARVFPRADEGKHARPRHLFLERLQHLSATRGHAAGAQADAYVDLRNGQAGSLRQPA